MVEHWNGKMKCNASYFMRTFTIEEIRMRKMGSFLFHVMNIHGLLFLIYSFMLRTDKDHVSVFGFIQGRKIRSSQNHWLWKYCQPNQQWSKHSWILISRLALMKVTIYLLYNTNEFEKYLSKMEQFWYFFPFMASSE